MNKNEFLAEVASMVDPAYQGPNWSCKSVSGDDLEKLYNFSVENVPMERIIRPKTIFHLTKVRNQSDKKCILILFQQKFPIMYALPAMTATGELSDTYILQWNEDGIGMPHDFYRKTLALGKIDLRDVRGYNGEYEFTNSLKVRAMMKTYIIYLLLQKIRNNDFVYESFTIKSSFHFIFTIIQRYMSSISDVLMMDVIEPIKFFGFDWMGTLQGTYQNPYVEKNDRYLVQLKDKFYDHKKGHIYNEFSSFAKQFEHGDFIFGYKDVVKANDGTALNRVNVFTIIVAE